jgi:hypothetical protein
MRVQHCEAPQHNILHMLYSNVYLNSKSSSLPTVSSYILNSVQVKIKKYTDDEAHLRQN